MRGQRLDVLGLFGHRQHQHQVGEADHRRYVSATRQHDWLVNCRNWFYRLPRLSWDSVVGHAAPISHAAGYLFLPAWLAGATNLLYGPFDVPTVPDMSERHRVTHTFAAPSMLAALAAEPTAANRDWSALGCILIGGAPVTDATINAGRRVFGDVIYQVFGQTEATLDAM